MSKRKMIRSLEMTITKLRGGYYLKPGGQQRQSIDRRSILIITHLRDIFLQAIKTPATEGELPGQKRDT